MGLWLGRVVGQCEQNLAEYLSNSCSQENNSVTLTFISKSTIIYKKPYLSVLVGSEACGGGYGKGAGFEPKKFKSEFSPNRNASGCGVSNFSPPIMK